MADVIEAHRWYEQQRPGLGVEFEQALEHALEIIGRKPTAFQVLHRQTRRILLDRFPFALYYRIAVDALEVVACLHTRRHPKHWQRHS